jgi:hypothetical protein
MPDAPVPNAPTPAAAAAATPTATKAHPRAAPKPAAKPDAAPEVKLAESPPVATPAAKAEAMRMLKLKMEGLAEELELPEAEVLRLAGHNASTLVAAKKQADELLALKRRLAEDPDAVLAELGLDLDKRAVERVNRQVQAQIDAETLTPEQKELRELRAERENRAKAEAERAGNEKKAAADVEKRKHMDHFANVILEALKQTTLPQGSKDEQLFTTQLMAQQLQQSIKNKLFVNPALLAKATEEMFRTAAKPVLGKMAAEHLADFVGPDALKGLVKVYAQRQGLTAAAKTDEKKPQSAADKRAAEKNATQSYLNGTRRAWRR